MMTSEPPGDIWRAARKHPRIALSLPVQLHVGDDNIATNTLNLSVGRMLLQPQQKPLALVSIFQSLRGPSWDSGEEFELMLRPEKVIVVNHRV